MWLQRKGWIQEFLPISFDKISKRGEWFLITRKKNQADLSGWYVFHTCARSSRFKYVLFDMGLIGLKVTSGPWQIYLYLANNKTLQRRKAQQHWSNLEMASSLPSSSTSEHGQVYVSHVSYCTVNRYHTCKLPNTDIMASKIQYWPGYTIAKTIAGSVGNVCSENHKYM